MQEQNPIVTDILVPVINVLSAVVGVVVVLSLIVAGIQYIWNADTSAKVEAAKNRIIAAIVAFVIYIFGMALLQFLIPGGILNQ